MKKNERKPTVPEQPRPRQEVPRVTPDPTQGLTMEQVQLRHPGGLGQYRGGIPHQERGADRPGECVHLL